MVREIRTLEIILGREPTCDIIIDGTRVSKDDFYVQGALVSRQLKGDGKRFDGIDILVILRMRVLQIRTSTAVLADRELDLESIDAIAAAGGPGSFTGLRIGSAAAKGIGLALDKPLIHVPTLEGLAYHFYGSPCLVVPMIDARNKQVFAGIYTFGQIQPEKDTEPEDPLCVICDQTAIGVAQLCTRLNELAQESGKTVLLLGDGAHVYRDLLEEQLTMPHWYAPAHLSQQKAGSVAVRAADLARQGKLETAAQHRPDYLRVSQAERVRAQRLGQ